MREPSIGSWISILETATSVKAYFVGTPNPIMMRAALAKIGLTSDETAIIGDSMWTDIAAGVEGAIESVLVLSGNTSIAHFQETNLWGWLPYLIIDNVGNLAPNTFHLKYNKGVRDFVGDPNPIKVFSPHN